MRLYPGVNMTTREHDEHGQVEMSTVLQNHGHTAMHPCTKLVQF
jgi:hypothetical protein